MRGEVRSPVSAIHARVQHYVGDISFFHSCEHFPTFGATFFCWRDFFFTGATFFCWRDFFLCWRDFFFTGATFFLLARLFLLALLEVVQACHSLLIPTVILFRQSPVVTRKPKNNPTLYVVSCAKLREYIKKYARYTERFASKLSKSIQHIVYCNAKRYNNSKAMLYYEKIHLNTSTKTQLRAREHIGSKIQQTD